MDKTLIETTLPESKRMKDYLNNSWRGIWTMAEWDKECAYWFIACDDLKPLLLPTRPQEILEYDKLSPQEKKNTSDRFWRQERVYNYLEQKQHVLDRNRGMFAKLIEFKNYIPEGDITTRAKFDDYIRMYKEFFNPTPEYKENWQDI